ncbi:MAG: response regulator [Actinobacteria bacterium]|nr:MAG: response regulator [Actinomycetota bacterium]
MLIEDEPFYMQITIEVMECAGFTTEVVDTVEHVPARLDEGDYDAIVLDIMLDCASDMFTRAETRSGFLTGCRVYERYIEPRLPNVPIVVVSALNPRTPLGEEGLRFFRERNVPIFNKPFDDEKLASKLAALTNA